MVLKNCLLFLLISWNALALAVETSPFDGLHLSSSLVPSNSTYYTLQFPGVSLDESKNILADEVLSILTQFNETDRLSYKARQINQIVQRQNNLFSGKTLEAADSGCSISYYDFNQRGFCIARRHLVYIPSGRKDYWKRPASIDTASEILKAHILVPHDNSMLVDWSSTRYTEQAAPNCGEGHVVDKTAGLYRAKTINLELQSNVELPLFKLDCTKVMLGEQKCNLAFMDGRRVNKTQVYALNLVDPSQHMACLNKTNSSSTGTLIGAASEDVHGNVMIYETGIMCFDLFPNDNTAPMNDLEGAIKSYRENEGKVRDLGCGGNDTYYQHLLDMTKGFRPNQVLNEI